MKKQKYWYKIDNAGKLFPAISKDARSNIFRLSFYLNENIDPVLLQQAVNETIPRFETFAVQIKNGLFWQYFGANSRIFKVELEPARLCKHFSSYQNRGYLFKVYYLENKITLETFHAISDGTGGMHFLKSIVYKYLKLQGYQIEHQNKILGELPYSKKESEDTFVSNYDKNHKLRLQEEKAYHIKGEEFANHWLLLVKIKLDTKQLLDYIKSTYHVTLTQFISALIAYSIFNESIDFIEHKKPIKMFVPVNLRPYFDSKTLRNFSLYIKSSFSSEKRDWTFEEMLEITKADFFDQINKDMLHQRINALVGFEKNMLIRVLPFVLKNVAFKIGYNILGEQVITCSLSNLGICDLPDDMKPYINDADFVNSSTGLAVTVLSIENHTNINFATPKKDLSIINYFVSFLTKAGLDVTIDTNYKEAYDEIL
ncbi:MAG: hypothetical protein WCR19_01415 [Acholeplasmataceae bacterium]